MTGRICRSVIATAALTCLLSCGESGEGGIVSQPHMPTFLSDKRFPTSKDLYLVGEAVSPGRILLHVECLWVPSKPPWSLHLDISMPIDALELVELRRGPDWPNWGLGPGDEGLARCDPAGEWEVGITAVSGFGSEGCPISTPYKNGALRLATLVAWVNLTSPPGRSRRRRHRRSRCCRPSIPRSRRGRSRSRRSALSCRRRMEWCSAR